MDEISKKLSELIGSAYFCGPITTPAIISAEKELGLIFPPSYRLFLEQYGALVGEGFEIYGLPPENPPSQPPQWGDVVKKTLGLRPNWLPENSVQISHDGCDHGYFLRCSQTDSRFEGGVMEWGPDHNGGVVIANSFLEFLEFCLSR